MLRSSRFLKANSFGIKELTAFLPRDVFFLLVFQRFYVTAFEHLYYFVDCISLNAYSPAGALTCIIIYIYMEKITHV